MTYHIESLATLALTDLVDLVNRAYVGYPGAFSPEEPEEYGAWGRAQNLDMARSVLARDAAGTPIGFGLLGIRGTEGWCAEFGVVPAWRRRGLGRALLIALLESARAAGCRRVRLEVAANNRPAQQLYAQGGFRLGRVLHSYSGTPGALGLRRAAQPPDLQITPGEIAGLLRFPALAPEPPPAWDHELATLLAEGGQTWIATRTGQPGGLLHATAPDAGDLQIRRLLVTPGDMTTARGLLAVAAGIHNPQGEPYGLPQSATRNPQSERLLVAYVAEASPLYTLLPRLGFQELEADWEMEWTAPL
jgi:ribosomal protein S18 acetylase RimI-like enzyme